MNEWVEKSIELANSTDYLDRLQEVYPVTIGLRRVLPEETKRSIKQAYDHRNSHQLVKMLLKLKKFPIKDPYVAYLRKKDGFLQLNPQTIQRIANALYDMDFQDIIDGCEEPKEFNRQIGSLFGNWLPRVGYPMVAERDLVNATGTAFLKGSDQDKKRFANDVLGCNLDKGPDLLAKVSNWYVVGEAKFLTDSGGHQNAQFQDALRLLRGTEGRTIRIAVLDGVVWIRGNSKMNTTVRQLDKVCLSALLLRDFLQSLS